MKVMPLTIKTTREGCLNTCFLPEKGYYACAPAKNSTNEYQGEDIPAAPVEYIQHSNIYYRKKFSLPTAHTDDDRKKLKIVK